MALLVTIIDLHEGRVKSFVVETPSVADWHEKTDKERYVVRTEEVETLEMDEFETEASVFMTGK